MVLGVAKTIVGSTLRRGVDIISVSSILSVTSSGDCSRPQNQDTTALHVSGKLPTYPSLKPPLTHTSHSGQNIGLGGGVGGQLSRNVKNDLILQRCSAMC